MEFHQAKPTGKFAVRFVRPLPPSDFEREKEREREGQKMEGLDECERGRGEDLVENAGPT